MTTFEHFDGQPVKIPPSLRFRFATLVLAAGATCALAAISTAAPRDRAFNVDTQRALAADNGAGEDWVLHGRTFSEQRYSPLSSINTENVGALGLAWQLQPGTDW